MRRARRAPLALLALLAGCDLRPTLLEPTVDAAGWPDGPAADAGTATDAHPARPDGPVVLDGGVVCVPQPETCNGLDDDCNGVVDDVDPDRLAADPNHCGQCGRACVLPHASGSCALGECRFACEAPWEDADTDLALGLAGSDGCECQPSHDRIEICDGRDNDCNGATDDGDLPGVGAACQPVPACPDGVCRPPCSNGLTACVGGQLACAGARGPVPEICDGEDNDCNGLVDDGFDVVNDVNNCGQCGNDCQDVFLHPESQNALAFCDRGQCQRTCRPDYWDADDDYAPGRTTPKNGCEYHCTYSGPEVCDGADNDCNGRADTDDPGLMRPADNFCRQKGACAGAAPVCTSYGLTTTWVCSYGPDVEVLALNQVATSETRCDGKDNDCDGATDEDFPLKGGACGDTVLGVCRGTGHYRCTADGTDVACVIEQPGAAPTHEVCDGLDNDCDGITDEMWASDGCGGECLGARDATVRVRRDPSARYPGGLDLLVYRFEAARPDATATDAGRAQARACSREQVLPWGQVNLAGAIGACTAAGLRLCTGPEWGAACEGPAELLFPYGASYGATTCNGNDYGGLTDVALPTGALAECRSAEGALDLSGNLKEWTYDYRSTVADRDIFTLRGGGYMDPEEGLTCAFRGAVAFEDFSFPTTGFRCCAPFPPCPAGPPCPPGPDGYQLCPLATECTCPDVGSCTGECTAPAFCDTPVDPAGKRHCAAYADWGSDPLSCGGCGQACPGGQVCANGACS
jgi:hypothetical protein